MNRAFFVAVLLLAALVAASHDAHGLPLGSTSSTATATTTKNVIDDSEGDEDDWSQGEDEADEEGEDWEDTGDEASASDAPIIDAIEIFGNNKTDRQVILRRILVSVGERIDDELIALSRLRLLTTGFFKSVKFSLKRGSARGRVLLLVEVEERNTILIDDLYFGFSSVAPFYGGFGLVETNFLGKGVTVGGGFVVGEDRRAVALRLFVPDLSNTPLQLSTSAIVLQGAEVLDEQDPTGSQLDYERIGGTLGVGLGAGPAQRVTLTYRLESVRAERLPNLEPAILRQAPSIQFDDSVLSTLALTYELDTRDDSFVPTQGNRFALGVEVGTSLIGSSYEFSKYTAEYQHAFLVFGRHSLALRAFGGLIQGRAPFFAQFFISDHAYFAFGRDSLPRNAEVNFSESNDYDDLIVSTGVDYSIPIQRGSTLLYRSYFYGGVDVSATASLDELQEDTTGRGTGGHLPISFDVGLKFDTWIGNFTLSLSYMLDLVF